MIDFTTTKQTLENLKNEDEPTLEMVLNIFHSVFKDCGKGNVDMSVQSLNTKDPLDVLKKLFSVSKFLTSAYDENISAEGDAFYDFIKDEHKKINDKLVELSNHLEKTEDEIKQNTQSNIELDKLNADLEKKCIEKKKVYDENVIKQNKKDELEADLKKYTDTYFGDLQGQIDTLLSQIEPLRQQESTLNTELATAQTDVDGVKGSIDALNKEIEDKKEEFNKCEQDAAIKEDEKKRLEKGIENAKQRIEDFKNWKVDFDNKTDEINKSYAEFSNENSAIVTAYNAIKRDELFNNNYDMTNEFFTKENAQDDLKLPKASINSYSELKSAFEGMENRISALLNIEQRILCILDKSINEFYKNEYYKGK